MKCMSDNSATHSQQCVHGRHIDGIINFTNYLIQNHYTEILWFFMSMACDRVRIMFSHHIKFYIRRLLVCFTKRANECEQACCSTKKKRSELTFRHFITSWYVAEYPYISTTLHLFYGISIRFDLNIEIVWHLFWNRFENGFNFRVCVWKCIELKHSVLVPIQWAEEHKNSNRNAFHFLQAICIHHSRVQYLCSILLVYRNSFPKFSEFTSMSIWMRMRNTTDQKTLKQRADIHVYERERQNMKSSELNFHKLS